MTDKIRGTCTECGKKTKVWLVNDVQQLCDECIDFLDYTQCDICGDFYPEDDVDFTELPDGRMVCEYCMEDLDEV